MGQSKRDFEDVRERCLLETSREFYEAHEELLKDNVTIKATYLAGERYNDNKEWRELFEVSKEARNKLRDKEAELRAINKLKE